MSFILLAGFLVLEVGTDRVLSVLLMLPRYVLPLCKRCPFVSTKINFKCRKKALRQCKTSSRLNYFHEEKYFFSWKEIFFFTMRNIFVHENNSRQTATLWRKVMLLMWYYVDCSIMKEAVLESLSGLFQSVKVLLIKALNTQWQLHGPKIPAVPLGIFITQNPSKINSHSLDSALS